MEGGGAEGGLARSESLKLTTSRTGGHRARLGSSQTAIASPSSSSHFPDVIVVIVYILCGQLVLTDPRIDFLCLSPLA